MIEKRHLSHINLTNLIWVLCCFACCITGHEWSGTIVSLCRYAIFSLLLYLSLQNKIKLDKGLYIFTVGIFSSAVACAIYNTLTGYAYFNLFVHIRQTVYFLLFAYCGYYIAYKKKDKDIIFKTIHYISLIAACIIVLQFVLHLFNFYLNRIPIAGEVFFKAVDTVRYFRPSAFFSEPSYFAEICLIDMFNNLFRNKNYKAFIFELIAILCSTSALGIVFGYSLAVIWGYKQRIFKKIIINTTIKFIMTIILLVLIIYVWSYSGDNAIILRILNGATINQRTLRSFEIFSGLDNYHKVLGIGMQNLSNYLNVYSVNLFYDAEDTMINREFSQSFGYILCTLGISGAVILLNFLVDVAKKIKLKYFAFLILVCELLLTVNIITRVIFIIYMVVLYQLMFDSKREINKKCKV